MFKHKKINLKVLLFCFIILVFTFIFVKDKLNREHPFIASEDFTTSYNHAESREANVNTWLTEFLDQDKPWYRKNKRVLSYRINNITYASQDYFLVDMNINYRPGKKIEGFEDTFYLEMKLMLDNYHLLSIISEQEYLEKNERYEMRDVTNEESQAASLQVKESAGGLAKVSKNRGKTWTEIPVKFEELSDAYDREKGKNVSAIFYEYNTIVVVYKQKAETHLLQSDDKGETWRDTIVSIESDESFTSIHNPTVVVVNEQEIVLNAVVDNALGSVRNVLLTSTNQGNTFKYLKEFPSTKRIVDRTTLFDNHYYLLDQKGVLWKSVGGTMDFSRVEVPQYEDMVWGFAFNEVYTSLAIPFIDDQGDLIMQVHQGENGDIKADAMAEFLSQDQGETWTFVRYVKYLDRIID